MKEEQHEEASYYPIGGLEVEVLLFTCFSTFRIHRDEHNLIDNRATTCLIKGARHLTKQSDRFPPLNLSRLHFSSLPGWFLDRQLLRLVLQTNAFCASSIIQGLLCAVEVSIKERNVKLVICLLERVVQELRYLLLLETLGNFNILRVRPIRF